MARNCTAPGCFRMHEAKGLCRLHYKRQVRAEKRAAGELPALRTKTLPSVVSIVEGELGGIKLNNGNWVLIDPEDQEKVAGYNWVQRSNGKVIVYLTLAQMAANRIYATSKAGVYLHRFVMGATGNERLVHANGDLLDNRKSNIKQITTGRGHRVRKA